MSKQATSLRKGGFVIARRGLARRAMALGIMVIASPFASGPWQPAFSQTPDFPPGTATGTLVMGVFPEGRINGASVRFAPGARIVGLDQRLVLPATLADQRHRVAYTRDIQGSIDRVWLITAEQARALAATRNR